MSKERNKQKLRIAFCLFLFNINFGLQAQIEGTYHSKNKSTVKYIELKSLSIMEEGRFKLVSSRTILEYDLPQQYIEEKIGWFTKYPKRIILNSDSLLNYQVNYSYPNTDLVKPKGGRKSIPIPTDTIILNSQEIKETYFLNIIPKPNSIYLGGCIENTVFIKYEITDYSKEHNLYTEEAQSMNDLNCALNTYGRKYRSVLNITDTLLINRQIDTLRNDCTKMVEYISSKKYSGEYIKQLVEKLILNELCPLQILENLSFFFQNDESIRAYEEINYPIQHLLSQKPKLKERLFITMNKGGVVCKLNPDSLLSNTYSGVIKHLLWQYKTVIEQNGDLSTCEIEKLKKLESN